MSTESENPYAPPGVDETFESPKENWEDDLVFRSGRDVHIFRNAALPARCMMTGDAATQSVTYSATWHPSWVTWLILPGILPYLVVAGSFRQRISLRLPVQDKLLARHDSIIRRGFTVMAASALAFVVVFIMESASMRPVPRVLFIAPVLCGVLGFLMASRRPVYLRIIYASNNLLILRGAHRDYLGHLPELPAGTQLK